MDKQDFDQSEQQLNADRTSQNAVSSYTDTNDDAGILLQNMVEDCLLVIFSMESLELMDLCSLAETCKRFRSITRRVIIAKKLDFRAYNSRFGFSSKKIKFFRGRRIDDGDVERIFRNFGPCLSRVSIGGLKNREQPFLWNLVKSHCGEELKHLTIRKIRISAKLIKELEPVFRRIHTLRLQEFTIDKSLFSQLHSLVELTLIGVQNCGTILGNIFPKLELFNYSCCPIPITCDTCGNYAFLQTLKTFISSHSALKSLELTLSYDWCTNILQEVETICRNLETLCMNLYFLSPMEYSPISLKPVMALKSLKTVKLSFVSLEDFEVFTFLTELRHLELKYCILPKDVKQFSCFFQLTHILLSYCQSSGVFDVADIIQHLVNLEEFEFEGFNVSLNNGEYILDETQFSRIVQIVKGRSNVLNLKVRYDFTVKRTVNENVKLYHLKRKL